MDGLYDCPGWGAKIDFMLGITYLGVVSSVDHGSIKSFYY